MRQDTVAAAATAVPQLSRVPEGDNVVVVVVGIGIGIGVDFGVGGW